MHSSRPTCRTSTAEDVMTGRDTTSALKVRVQKRSETTCIMHIFEAFSGVEQRRCNTATTPGMVVVTPNSSPGL
jgi:hypothetical protein